MYYCNIFRQQFQFHAKDSGETKELKNLIFKY